MKNENIKYQQGLKDIIKNKNIEFKFIEGSSNKITKESFNTRFGSILKGDKNEKL